MAETGALARERARHVLGRNDVRHQYPNRVGTSQMATVKIDPAMPDEAVDVDDMMEHLWIVGDPRECADRIRRLHETVGGFGRHRSLELLIADVGPRIADLT